MCFYLLTFVTLPVLIGNFVRKSEKLVSKLVIYKKYHYIIESIFFIFYNPFMVFLLKVTTIYFIDNNHLFYK